MRTVAPPGYVTANAAFGTKTREADPRQTTVTFADVAGVDEAKEEVKEIVDFLREPGRFAAIGGRIPKGVLLVGPPGTDAVGRRRGGNSLSHEEREQTLNQMLVEMDGFAQNQGIVVVAATNRPDILDPALLRPGRFDRQVTVGAPDLKGREQILQIHARKVALESEIDLRQIARGTPCFSGADLANLVNEAALFVVRQGREVVTAHDFDQARDKVLMGGRIAEELLLVESLDAAGIRSIMASAAAA